MCLGCVALSMGCIMAGTGDIGALRAIRALRFKVDAKVTYGNHMAIHMALGMVFLGGGELTLGRSNEAIAALVMSIFPRFPNSSQDNQYHLQPPGHQVHNHHLTLRQDLHPDC